MNVEWNYKKQSNSIKRLANTLLFDCSLLHTGDRNKPHWLQAIFCNIFKPLAKSGKAFRVAFATTGPNPRL